MVALILNFAAKGFACGGFFFPPSFSLSATKQKQLCLADLVWEVRQSVFVYSEGSAMWPDSLSCCAE